MEPLEQFRISITYESYDDGHVCKPVPFLIIEGKDISANKQGIKLRLKETTGIGSYDFLEFIDDLREKLYISDEKRYNVSYSKIGFGDK